MDMRGDNLLTVFPLINSPRLSNFVVLRKGTFEGSCLKEESDYFKVREIIHMKSQNLVILSFQIPTNNFHYDI